MESSLEDVKEEIVSPGLIYEFLSNEGIYEKLEGKSPDEIQAYFETHSEELFEKFKVFLLSFVRDRLLDCIEDTEVVSGMEVTNIEKVANCLKRINFTEWL